MKQVDIKQAIEKKYPEVVVLVTSIDKSGKPNVMPAGWFAFSNSEPACLTVAIGYKRYTHKLISQTKEFVVCFPSLGQEKDIEYCGEVSGAEVDKFANCNLEILPAVEVKPPLIKNSVACFECKIINMMDLADHTVFAGEIVAAHISDNKRIYNFGHRVFKTV
ncbi:MAG: flavin reductase family protein [Patescibacteria group bacterium]|jgi:flavin reductase (DIM6/NTAB) family NADH-FMN oxidoreductase RutF